jgi:hypothetical protein
MTFDVRRRVRRLCLLAAALGAMTMPLVSASPALAGTDTYCSSCVVADNTMIADAYSFFITLSYFHYLGLGDRWIGVGAVNYASFVWGYNEVAHSYSGGNWLQGAAQNASGHSITANAHVDF